MLFIALFTVLTIIGFFAGPMIVQVHLYPDHDPENENPFLERNEGELGITRVAKVGFTVVFGQTILVGAVLGAVLGDLWDWANNYLLDRK